MAAVDVLDLHIPSSLRTIAPFLEEAQSILRYGENANQKVVLFCIDHALRLVTQFGLAIDDEAETVLRTFHEKRDVIAKNLGLPVTETAFSAFKSASGKDVSAEDILIAEGNATLELADQQMEEGMHRAAARNYHTATVYFRVLESMVPRLTSRVHASLTYAACRTQQSSHLLANLVHEHFEGLRCVDFYEIIENKRLGKGSYGSVYLCKHRKTGDEFACKVIGMNRINSHYLRKLHLEISIMKEIDHPNIIKLREVFYGSRTVYLVMELCQGGELFDEITHNAQRGLNEPHAAKLMCDMMSAVLYLHQHGIAHRDLKLENFLFEKPGMHSPLKLIDFGLSKHFDPNESMHQVVGSAYYTAPEVLGGCYDNRCDIWSLGVIAYMLLSGAPPFNGDTSEKIHSLILTKEPDYSKKLFPKASDPAIDFLKKMLTKDPSKRITLEQAFEHPFLQEVRYMHMQPDVAPPSIDVMQSLTRFMRLSRYKKFMLQAVAFSLSPSQISILRDEFNAIDKDRSGTISLGELQEYITKMSPDSSPAATRLLTLAAENYDPGEEINYIEFLAAAMCKRISIDEERLVLAFETLDIDSKGYLDADAIRRAMGAGISDAEVTDMIAEVDEDKTGRINYIDFVKFWRTFVLSQNVTPLQKLQRAVRKVSNSLVGLRIMRGSKHKHYYNQNGSQSTLTAQETHVWTKDVSDHSEPGLTLQPEGGGENKTFERRVSFTPDDDVKRSGGGGGGGTGSSTGSGAGSGSSSKSDRLSPGGAAADTRADSKASDTERIRNADWRASKMMDAEAERSRLAAVSALAVRTPTGSVRIAAGAGAGAKESSSAPVGPLSRQASKKIEN